MFKFLLDDKKNYGLKLRAQGEGMYGMYCVGHTRFFVIGSLLISFYYSLGMVSDIPPLLPEYFHYWFFYILYWLVIIPLHVIGIPLAFSGKFAYKFQAVLFFLKMNYLIALPFFMISAMFLDGAKGKTSSTFFSQQRLANTRIYYILLILWFFVALLIAYMYVKKQFLLGKYSEKQNDSNYVSIPGLRTGSTIGVGAMAGFQLIFNSVTKNTSVFIVSSVFTVFFIYAFSFMFIEQLFTFYIKVRYKLNEPEENFVLGINWRAIGLSFKNIVIRLSKSKLLMTSIIGLLFLICFPQVILWSDKYLSLHYNTFRIPYLIGVFIFTIRIVYLFARKIFLKKEKKNFGK